MIYHLGTALVALIICVSSPVRAQSLPSGSAAGAEESDPSGTDPEIEELYDKEEAKPAKAASERSEQKAPEKPLPDASTLSDLARLAPFSDIAVIQRRFLPKTKRFEATAVGFTNLNNPFFNTVGVGFKLAYYLREQYAIEGIADFGTTSARQVTNDLNNNRRVTTNNVVTTKGFYGGGLKWNPIYGKITLLNQNIVPFDLNFSLGFGVTPTADGQNAPTFHFGTSQVFAWTKSAAFRWDFSWNYYQANGRDQNDKIIKLAQNDLYLGLGMSFYFPEAGYR